MTNPQIQNDPVYSLPFLYINGMSISNDGTTPNTVLDISAGQCRDSNDVIDITLGSPNIQGSTVNAPLLLNAAVNGVNGLDQGTLAASSMYSIFMIADSRYIKPTGSIAVLGSSTAVVPLLPAGYDSYRLIGYWPTDSSAHFLKGYMSYSTSGSRWFYYDSPAFPGSVTTETGYTPLSLLNIVPNVNNLQVVIQAIYTGNSVANNLYLQGGAQTGDEQYLRCQTTSAAFVNNVTLLSQVVSGAPKINYKMSSGSDAAVLNVAAFAVQV